MGFESERSEVALRFRLPLPLLALPPSLFDVPESPAALALAKLELPSDGVSDLDFGIGSGILSGDDSSFELGAGVSCCSSFSFSFGSDPSSGGGFSFCLAIELEKWREEDREVLVGCNLEGRKGGLVMYSLEREESVL